MPKFQHDEEPMCCQLPTPRAPDPRGGLTQAYCLHTADPGVSWSATTSECVYGSYARGSCSKCRPDGTNPLSNTNPFQFPPAHPVVKPSRMFPP